MRDAPRSAAERKGGCAVMVQDIEPDRLDNRYYPGICPDGGSRVICVRDGETLVSENDASFPFVRDFADPPELIYAFSISGERYFIPRYLKDDTEIPRGFVYRGIAALRESRSADRKTLFAAMTGRHLADWYASARFCGRCGCEMRPDVRERAMLCPACGYILYPRINPAVIVGVCDGDRIILTRYKTGFRHNALIAGFCEIGETAEGAVAREVMEEVGLKVKNIRYYKSQPWGTAGDLLLGYFCEVDGDKNIRMDPDELGHAAWTERDSVVLQPDGASLTNEMMRVFKEGGV